MLLFIVISYFGAQNYNYRVATIWCKALNYAIQKIVKILFCGRVYAIDKCQALSERLNCF